MARRRMFSIDVVDTDPFLDLPLSAQALYFHLGVRADDDGFVNSHRRVASICGASDTDFENLVKKGFVIVFPDGICVITHWKTHNYIQNDRYKRTLHLKHLAQLKDENGTYYLKNK